MSSRGTIIVDLGDYDFPPTFMYRHYPSNLHSLKTMSGARRAYVPTELYELIREEGRDGYYEETARFDPALEEVFAVMKRAYPDEE